MVRCRRRSVRPDQPLPPFIPTPVAVTKPSSVYALLGRHFARWLLLISLGPRQNPSRASTQGKQSAAEVGSGTTTLIKSVVSVEKPAPLSVPIGVPVSTHSNLPNCRRNVVHAGPV
jgi:hypothetical protein